MKKLIALLLTLALPLALALPAFADSEATEDPAMPVITAQPKGGRVTIEYDRPKSCRLEVAAHIPNDDPIGYRWYRGDTLLMDTWSNLWYADQAGDYRVEVYNRNAPALCVTSQIAAVEEYTPMWERIRVLLDRMLKPLRDSGIREDDVLQMLLLPFAILVLPLEALFGAAWLSIPLLAGMFGWIVDLFRA